MIKSHPLIIALKELKGNTKACVLTEPLWGIPNNLYAPFVTVYMFALGLSYIDIGIIISIGTFFQIFFAFLSGYITDKFGRRKTTFFYDFLAWSAPTLVWALSQNFWWFLIAALLNSTLQITTNSWTCLLVEDTDKKTLVNVYNWIYVSDLLAVIFAPLAGILVNSITVVPAMRILYVIAFISMTVKFILLYIYSTETEQGKIRMAETKNITIKKYMYQYKDVLKTILKAPETLSATALMILLSITTMIKGNFFSLYITNDLQLPEQLLGFFPIIRAAIVLVFLIGIQHQLDKLHFKVPMLIGVLIFLVSNILFILLPAQNLAYTIVYIAIDACAFAILMPRKDSLITVCIDPKERTRIQSLMFSISLLVSSPFGYIAGLLSNIDSRLPFIMNVFLFFLAGIILIGFKNVYKRID